MTNYNFTIRAISLCLFGLVTFGHISGQSLVIHCSDDVIVDVSTLPTPSAGVETQDLVDAAFSDWATSFTFVANGCNPVASGKEGLTAPSAVFGGSTNINYTVTDDCGNTQSCSGTFSVSGTVVSPIIVSCPPDIQLDDAATQFQVDSAFNVWINAFTSFPTTALTTDLSSLVPPAIGGDPVQVTYIAEDPSNSANINSCQSTFIPPSSSLTNANDEIPTMGQWGLISLSLLLLIFCVNGIRVGSVLAIK